MSILIGLSCIFAFVLQNFEGWHRKYVLSNIEPELIQGKIASINLLPSNTTTSYVVSVDFGSGESAKLIASLGLARTCQVGETIQVEKRGLDYQFSAERCGDD